MIFIPVGHDINFTKVWGWYRRLGTPVMVSISANGKTPMVSSHGPMG